jgi:hypothetical protein
LKTTNVRGHGKLTLAVALILSTLAGCSTLPPGARGQVGRTVAPVRYTDPLHVMDRCHVQPVQCSGGN